MNILVPVPSDVYEPTFSITGGTANAVITFGSAYLIGTGLLKWYPIVPSITLDAAGNGSVICTANQFAPLGAATVSNSYNWSTPLPTNLPAAAVCASSPLSTFGEFARQLASLLGPATQAVDGSRIAEDYRTIASALAGASASLEVLVGDMFPDTATDLIGKWEQFLGLVTDTNLALTSRQANALAKWRALFGGQPKVIQAALQAIDGGAQVLEWTTTQIAAASSNVKYATAMQRRVFLFSIALSPSSLAKAATLALIRSIVRQMMPVYSSTDDAAASQGSVTAVGVGVLGPFKCDDANSLTDQTLLAT